jgi:predicted outer membrane protein
MLRRLQKAIHETDIVLTLDSACSQLEPLFSTNKRVIPIMKAALSLAAAACTILTFAQISNSQTTSNGSPLNVEDLQPKSLIGSVQPTTSTRTQSFTRTNQPDAPNGLLAPIDEKFVSDTAMGNNAIIAMSRIAKERAAIPSVRDFAERSLQRSESANQDMAQLVEEIGVKLPDGVALNDEFVIDRLQDLKGTDLDQAYVRQQMGLLATLIDTYRDAEKSMKDKRLRTFAKERLRSIEERYQELRALDNRSSPAMSMVIKVDQ